MNKIKLAIFTLALSLIPGCMPKNNSLEQEVSQKKLEEKLEINGSVIDVKTNGGQRHLLVESYGNYYDVYGANTSDFEKTNVGDSVYLLARRDMKCEHHLFEKPNILDLTGITTFYTP